MNVGTKHWAGEAYRMRDIRKAINKYFMRDPTPENAKNDLLRLRMDIEIMLTAIEMKFPTTKETHQ